MNTMKSVTLSRLWTQVADHLTILTDVLTRAPLGYSAERAPLGGGADSAPPLPNSRTNRLSEAGEAAIESPEREDSIAH